MKDKNEQITIYDLKSLVDYLRETFDNGSCILTSHSETILNLIKNGHQLLLI